MTNRNFFSDLAKENLPFADRNLRIAMACAEDEKLFEFFLTQSVGILKLVDNNDNPTQQELAQQMTKCTFAASINLEGAQSAYEMFLDLGPMAVMVGLIRAKAMVNADEKPEQEKESPFESLAKIFAGKGKNVAS